MQFVSNEFSVPTEIETDRFRVRLLTMADTAKDYDAYMTSMEHLPKIFDPNDTVWPTPDVNMRMAFSDTAFCEWEHYTRQSFSYGVFDLDDRRELGCVYVWPTHKSGYDAQLMTWVRASELSASRTGRPMPWRRWQRCRVPMRRCCRSRGSA